MQQLVERASAILLRPRPTWEVIDAEPADSRKLFTSYLMVLAAIPAVCGFIGMSLLGVGAFGFSMRIPVLTGLVNAVLSYAFSLVGVIVLSLIINALGPTFGGVKNQDQAFKVAVYGSTAALVGGVFALLPALAMLGLVTALYSVYLLYLGLPLLMRAPAQRAVPYTVAVVVAAIVMGVVMSMVLAALTPRGPALWGGAGGGPAVAVDTPRGRVTVNTAGLEEASRKMEDAARRMEQAGKSGDTAAMNEAAQQVAAVAAGALGQGVRALDGAALKAALPERLGGRARTGLDVQSGAAMGVSVSQASARYGDGVRVQILDMGAMGQLAQIAGMVQGESESDGQVDKTWQEGGRTLQQSYAKDGSQAEMRAILKNGVMVSIEAEGTGIKEVQSLLAQLDLKGLEGLQRPAK
ncbi:YIP1 family protein [Melaminivora suipulveris]|uniref:YIP1 family protein n=1 Tax=Melaminivora suipulveris TaxID=2109913 RepID=A0A2R3QDU4_9BURK|nr:Yip1 family protein [Melaminivora suipulveris]AVO49942.1 YIP1 family protein [Melaminivora suipulveris]